MHDILTFPAPWCLACRRTTFIEFAINEPVLAPDSVAEVTLLVDNCVGSLHSVRLSLHMEIELYKLTEPELLVDISEQELGYSVTSKEALLEDFAKNKPTVVTKLSLDKIRLRNEQVKELMLVGDEDGDYSLKNVTQPNTEAIVQFSMEPTAIHKQNSES